MRDRLLAPVLGIVWLFSGPGPRPLSAQEHAGQYTQAEIERGSRLYVSNCSLCHGVNGDSVPNVDLRAGRFRRAASDEELSRLILAGIPGTAMPAHQFDREELSGILAFVRSLRDRRGPALKDGDAARGRALVQGKGDCLACHRIGGRGSRVAPDLSEIGLARPASVLERSLLNPTAAMLPINRPVRAVLHGGAVVTGRRLNEDTYSVQLIDTQERLVSLLKADLEEYTVLKVSPMPSYRDKLSVQELADIVAYLRTLRGLE